PDGQSYLCEDGKDLTLCARETGQVIRRFSGHTTAVRCVAFSVDGRQALSGAGSLGAIGGAPPTLARTVRVWRVAAGKEQRCFGPQPGTVGTAAFGDDGRHIHVVCDAGRGQVTRRVFDLQTGKDLPRFESDRIVLLSPDGLHFFCGYTNRVPEFVD